MTKMEYVARLQIALTQFIMDTMPEIECPMDEKSIKEANDELMLEIFQQTGDSRRA